MSQPLAKQSVPKPHPDPRVQRAETVVTDIASRLEQRAWAEDRRQLRRMRWRRALVILSFLGGVVAPVAVAAWYLYTIALDQYAAHVGFSVRKETSGAAIELLGGLTDLSGTSTTDTDILYEFIQSPQIVRAVAGRLDLGAIYDRPEDPVFGLGPDRRIEAMSAYWRRMVKVFYDPAAGLIEVRVLAFDPHDANQIATAVFDESSALVNRLSDIARADTTRHARDTLDLAMARLKAARQALTAFRNRTQIVDPTVDIKGQMGLVNSLQTQLAEAIIARELLLETAHETDPRVVQQSRKIDVIQSEIGKARARFGSGDGTTATDSEYARLLEEFESLTVDHEFAQAGYVTAQTAYDMALADAQRQSRYLASYIEPTLAETAEYPQRAVLLAMIAGFLLLGWSILVMMAYALRDRR